jgi:quinol monooxygenase YgiN
MFERYTEQARRALFFARYEASQLGSPTVDAEHLLLGLLREGSGATARIVGGSGLDLLKVRAAVGDASAGRPKVATSVEMPIAERCKSALQQAASESDRLEQPFIGPEHLLLALLHQPDSLAGRILDEAGLTLATARAVLAEGAGSTAVREHHVVLVQVTIRPELADAFEKALLHNARESVRRDPGCLRFDVSQDKDDPAKWVLYEVYDAPESHAKHRQSPHFLAYDAIATQAVLWKTVSKGTGRCIS